MIISLKNKLVIKFILSSLNHFMAGDPFYKVPTKVVYSQCTHTHNSLLEVKL